MDICNPQRQQIDIVLALHLKAAPQLVRWDLYPSDTSKSLPINYNNWYGSGNFLDKIKKSLPKTIFYNCYTLFLLIHVRLHKEMVPTPIIMFT